MVMGLVSGDDESDFICLISHFTSFSFISNMFCMFMHNSFKFILWNIIKLIHVTFVINCFNWQGSLIFNVCDIFFKGTPFSNIPHTYSTISPPSRGLPFTPSMFLNQITQSPILYEINKTMDNEKEQKVYMRMLITFKCSFLVYN
jgi:hypothetical protein